MILELCCCTNKIVQIMSGNGFYTFFTSSKKETYTCNSLDIDELIKINDYNNISYDEIYVSVMKIKENIEISLKSLDNLIYIFHEEKLDDGEIKCIEEKIRDFKII